MAVCVFTASRDITVNATGQQGVQTERFMTLDIPRKVARLIEESNDVNSFIEYLRMSEWCVEDEVDTFADDDVWMEHPIGKRLFNEGEEHIAALQSWVGEHSKDGWSYTISMEL